MLSGGTGVSLEGKSGCINVEEVVHSKEKIDVNPNVDVKKHICKSTAAHLCAHARGVGVTTNGSPRARGGGDRSAAQSAEAA